MSSFLEWLGHHFYEVDDPNRIPAWMISEIRDHDNTGCPGTSFVSGKWGGLICTTCGK